MLLGATAALALTAMPASIAVLGWETFLAAETDIFSSAYSALLTCAAGGVWLSLMLWKFAEARRPEASVVAVGFTRAALTGVFGLAGLVMALVMFPHILDGPYRDLPDIVKDEWLKELKIHKSVIAAASEHIAQNWLRTFALGLVVIASAAASWKRLDWYARLLVVVGIGSLVTMGIELRNEVFVAITIGLLLPFVVANVKAGAWRAPLAGCVLAGLLIGVPWFTGAQAKAKTNLPQSWMYMTDFQCAAYAEQDLATIPAGIIVAPVKLSYFILRQEGLDKPGHTLAHLGSHRTYPGKEKVLTAWFSDDEAVQASNLAEFDYLVVCEDEWDERFEIAPLYSDLQKGKIPDFLTDVGVAGSPMKIYRITP